MVATLVNRLLTTISTQMVETIWEGDVKEFSRAYDLMCIVDQIHDYAVNHHRPFVMNHLEAWHARHQKTLEPIKKAIAHMDEICKNADISVYDSDDISNDSFDFDTDSAMGDSDVFDTEYDFDELAELYSMPPKKPAEWFRLKEQSKNARQEIANETRKGNRRALNIPQAPKQVKEPQEKRPRGRPRKAGVVKKEAAPKRGRGRPPKKTNTLIKQ